MQMKTWPFIADHPQRILIIGGSLLNLIKDQDDFDKIYLYAKELSEPKYEFLIKKPKDVGIIYCNDPNAFIVQILWMMFMRILAITTQ